MKRFSNAMRGVVALLGLCCLLWGCESDLDKANALAKEGKKDLASEMYDKVLKDDKKNLGAWTGLAQLHCNAESYNGFRCLGAAKSLQKLKSTDPKVKDWLKRALFSNAYDRTTSGELVKAGKYLKEYLTLEPKDAKAYLIAALIKKRQGSSPIDPSELRQAIKRLDQVLQYATKTDTMKLDPKDKSDTPVKWEAAKMKGNLYETLLVHAMGKFEKSPAGKKKGAAFKPKETDFQGAVSAYQVAHSLSDTQPRKQDRFYPLYQVAMLYANFKNDTDKSLEILLKAEKAFPRSKNVLMGIYQVYKKKMEGLTGRRNRRKRKELKQLADQYLAKAANLPKARK